MDRDRGSPEGHKVTAGSESGETGDPKENSNRAVPTPPELTLDPGDWQAFRALAHRMVDDMLDHLACLDQQPAWRPMPDSVRSSFSEPLPREGVGEAAAYQAFRERVLPYPNGNLHPRFWGWVQGTGTPLAMMAEMLAAGMNPHMAGFDQAPALVERQVLAWLIELLGMPREASGVLVAGCMMANTLGLAVARHARAGLDVREEGIQGLRQRLVFYGSTETHTWARKSAELLGLGRRCFHQVPVGEDYAIDLPALEAMIAADRAAGSRPFCVIGTAGTVNTGAIDDLVGLAALARREGLWFHVDGAFGALARLSPALAPIVAGVELADSIGFDLHKWMYLPFEIACLLVRDPAAHHATFAANASYLGDATRGVIRGGLPFADRGLDLTRNFKALKAWMSLKAHGVDRFAGLIEQNVAQARHLAARVSADPELELLAPVPLNVVCFRYAPAGVERARLDDINQELLLRVQESGEAVPSSTVLRGRFALRVAIVNHRTREADLDRLLLAIHRFGRELAG